MLKKNDLVGHRGAMSIAPENTMASFKKCIDHGISWIETDVNLIKYDEPVIFHDDNLYRIAGKNQKISDIKIDQLKDIDIGSHFGDSFSAERIPRLDQFLFFMSENDLSLNLEIKKYPHFSEEKVAKIVARSVQEHWDSSGDIMISTFNLGVIRALRLNGYSGDIALLVEEFEDNLLELVKEIDIQWLNVDHNFLNHRVVESIKSHKLKISAYTVNDFEIATRLHEYGVDKIITDAPTLLEYENNK